MNFQFYLEKLYAQDSFKKFVEENKDAIPVTGFFVIDLEGKDNHQHFDYYIPSTNKLFSFQLEKGGDPVPIELVEGFIAKKLGMNYDFDFSDVEELIRKEMEKREIKNKIQKFLFSLQKKDNEDYLVGTVFISGFGMLKVNIKISSMEITHFEKKSFFDILKFKKKPKE